MEQNAEAEFQFAMGLSQIPVGGIGTVKSENKIALEISNLIVRSCRDSNKRCLSTLVRRACSDQGSITRQNLNFIEAESGLINVLELNNAIVGQNLKYEIPGGEEWRIDIFSELVQMSM